MLLSALAATVPPGSSVQATPPAHTLGRVLSLIRTRHHLWSCFPRGFMHAHQLGSAQVGGLEGVGGDS